MEKVALRATWTFSKSSGTIFTIGSGTATKLKREDKLRKRTSQAVPSHLLLPPVAPTLPDKSQLNIYLRIRSIVIKRGKNRGKRHKLEVT